MTKTSYLFALFLFFFIFSSYVSNHVLAFEFAGMTGRGDEPGNFEGKPNDVSWPAAFLKEVEAAQAEAAREASKYENWYIDRSIAGSIYEPRSKKTRKMKQLFWGEDQMIPKRNKCSNSDSNKILVYSTVVDRSYQKSEKSWFRDVNLIGEFTAVVSGFGWNCEGKSGEPYWNNDEEIASGRKITKAEMITRFATDDSYVDDFLQRSKNVKSVDLKLDQSENYYFDAATGIYLQKHLEPRKKFVMDNCQCEDKEENE